MILCEETCRPLQPCWCGLSLEEPAGQWCVQGLSRLGQSNVRKCIWTSCRMSFVTIESTLSCPTRWTAIRHLFQFQQRGVWPSCWLDVEAYVCCCQGNTFVIELVNRMCSVWRCARAVMQHSHLKILLVPLQDSPRGRRHLLFVFCPLAAEDGQRRRWVCHIQTSWRLWEVFGKLNLCVLSPLRCTGVWAAGLQSLWDAWETRRFLLHHHAEHWRWETFFQKNSEVSKSHCCFFKGKIY